MIQLISSGCQVVTRDRRFSRAAIECAKFTGQMPPLGAIERRELLGFGARIT